MDTFIVLAKYTSQGRKFFTPEDARKRWGLIAESLEKQGGNVQSHFVTMGGYDSVVTFQFPSGRDFTLFQCLNYLQAPGDIEVIVLRAWQFSQFAPTQAG